jgi:hypothetical protein
VKVCTDLSVSEKEAMADCCGHVNEHSGSMYARP